MNANDVICEQHPVLGSNFALRQIGDDLRYLMNWETGEYYELDAKQLDALKMADGTVSIADISAAADVSAEDCEAFFEDQRDEGFVSLVNAPLPAPQPTWYRYCEAPHLSDVLIEVTGLCNLKCAHCFNSDFNTRAAISREMTTTQMVNLIGQLDGLNTRRIQLSGGEALLRSDLWDIIEAIDEHRIFLDVISTNATKINSVNVERLAKRFSNNGALYISMDGLTADAYETLRGEGVFTRFDHAMSLLDEHECRIFINTMAVRSNLHQMDEMYDWMVAHPSVQGWRIGLPKVLGRYKQFHESLEVEFKEVIQVFKRLLVRWLADRPGFRLELSDFFRTDSLEDGLEDHRPTDNPCKYALTNMSIKPDGTAVFCASLEQHAPAILGNVLDRGLADVWYGAKQQAMCKTRIEDLYYCSCCRYSRICGGGCRSNALLSYGDFRQVDPRACEAMELLETEILPLLPAEFRDQVGSLIHHDRPFAPPSGYKKYI